MKPYVRINFLLFYFLLISFFIHGQGDKIIVKNDKNDWKLQVNGNDFMVNGMNWDYFPIGTNYSYSLWNQSDAFIQQALDEEMGLLKNLGFVFTGKGEWFTFKNLSGNSNINPKNIYLSRMYKQGVN